jgi:hypothetical protein
LPAGGLLVSLAAAEPLLQASADEESDRSREGRTMLPTFVIIGAMKGGTSSLYQYLNVHPEVCMSSIKETDFFIEEKNHRRGPAWYQSLFRGRAAQYGEASPNYSKWPRYDRVPERMHELIPAARLIYVVRDPIERMISHYAHRVHKGVESRPIDAALCPPAGAWYLAPSQYHTQLELFQRFYPPERILVLSSESLRTRRRTALARVFEFLGVDDEFDCPQFDLEHHQTERKFAAAFRMSWPQKLWKRLGFGGQPAAPKLPERQITDETRRLIAEFLGPEIEAFRRLTGQRFAEWSV